MFQTCFFCQFLGFNEEVEQVLETHGDNNIQFPDTMTRVN